MGCCSALCYSHLSSFHFPHLWSYCSILIDVPVALDILSMKIKRIKLTNIKYLEDEGNGEDDSDYGDEQLIVEGRKDDERVDGKGAPPSEDSVAREFGELS